MERGRQTETERRTSATKRETGRGIGGQCGREAERQTRREQRQITGVVLSTTAVEQQAGKTPKHVKTTSVNTDTVDHPECGTESNGRTTNGRAAT